jgi:hypothetical protein
MSKQRERLHVQIQATIQFGYPNSDGDDIYNIHLRNQIGQLWVVSHTFYQLARLDHLFNSKSAAISTVYYPVVSRDILARLQSKAGGESIDRRLRRVEHFRILLQKWVHAVINSAHELDKESNRLVELFFGLPGGPTESNPTYEFKISKFDNGVALDENAWELMSAYSAMTKQTTLTKSTIALAAAKATAESGRATNYSEGMRSVSRAHHEGELEPLDDLIIIKSKVMRPSTQEGNVLEYDVLFIVAKHKKPLKKTRRYNAFKELNEGLKKNGIVLLVPFPSADLKITMDETALSKRGNLLDCWFREVCCIFTHMSKASQQLVIDFYQFDLVRPQDIYIHDKLVYGQIEAPRAPIVAKGSNKDVTVLDRIIPSESTVPNKGVFSGWGKRAPTAKSMDIPRVYAASSDRIESVSEFGRKSGDEVQNPLMKGKGGSDEWSTELGMKFLPTRAEESKREFRGDERCCLIL